MRRKIGGIIGRKRIGGCGQSEREGEERGRRNTERVIRRRREGKDER